MSGQTRLEVIAPEDLGADQLELYRRFLDDAGAKAFQLLADNEGLRGPFNAFLVVPEVGDHVRQLARQLPRGGELRKDVYEAAILTVGGVWQAGYVVNMHTVRGLEAGLSPRLIAQLSDPASESVDGPPEVVAAWRFCRELATGRTVSDETYTTAHKRLGREGTVILVLLTGFYGLIGGILRTFHVDSVVPDRPTAA